MKKWLIIGIVIRLVIIPITFHPDLNLFILGNYLLVDRQLWLGFYDFLGSSSDPLAMIQPPTSFTYPPLAILSGGLFANVLYRLVDLEFVKEVLLDPAKYVGSLGFSWLMLLTKLHLLIVDVATGWMLSKVVGGSTKLTTQSKKIFALWMLNPITLYATFAIGQFDIYPVFFTVLAVWLVMKKRFYWSATALGIGGAFKLFPLLFLPFLIIGYGKSIKEKLKMIIVGGLAYLIPILPYLGSAGFRHYALLAPQTDKMLFAKIPVSGAEYLSVFVVGYMVLVWLFAKVGDSSAGRRLSQKDGMFWRVMAAVLLLFFTVTHFHPQWFVWVSPWLILMLFSPPYEGGARGGHLLNLTMILPVSVLLLAYLVIILSFESSLNWGILVWNQNASDLMSLLPQAIQLEKFKYLSLVRSVLAGTAVCMIYILLRPERTKYVSPGHRPGKGKSSSTIF